jgi:two-component system, LytTR family, sensor kinase
MKEGQWRGERSAPWQSSAEARDDRRTIGWMIAGLTLAFWLFNFTLLTLSNLMDAWPDWQMRAVARVLAMPAKLLLCYLIYRLLERWRERPFAHRGWLAFVLSIAAGEIYSWAITFANLAVLGEPIPALNGRGLFYIAYSMWFFLAWSAMYLALSYSAEVREQERRWAELRDLAHATHLRALTYQIHPHFLFNTLNSISAMVLDARIADADLMIRRLSEFLRASLALDPLQDVLLKDEIALQQLYLEIEQIRFPDLRTEISVPAELGEALVPSMILQPIVENSIKYAVSGRDGPAVIAITAVRDDGMLDLTVEDSGGSVEKTSGGNGIGLRNVRERLHEQYGDRQSLEARAIEPCGYRVTLRLPLQVRA